MFEQRVEENLAELRARLLDDTYYPLPLRRLNIPKKEGGERALAIPTVADRVAQRAFVNILEPCFEGFFMDCSFAYRPGRSVEQAVQMVLRHRADGYGWALDGDVLHFFDTVNHGLLMQSLRGVIEDRAVLRTISI